MKKPYIGAIVHVVLGEPYRHQEWVTGQRPGIVTALPRNEGDGTMIAVFLDDRVMDYRIPYDLPWQTRGDGERPWSWHWPEEDEA